MRRDGSKSKFYYAPHYSPARHRGTGPWAVSQGSQFGDSAKKRRDSYLGEGVYARVEAR